MEKIFRDDAGRLYAKALLPGTERKAIAISSNDGGRTWISDTTAPFENTYTALPEPYFVDETGTQHIARYQYLADNITIDLFARKPGGIWAPDEGGIHSWGGKTTLNRFCTDYSGSVYYSNIINGYSRLVWKRPVTGGDWTLDTAGLQGDAFTAFTSNRRGHLLGGTWANEGTRGKFWKKTGNRWEKIVIPKEFDNAIMWHAGLTDGGLIFARADIYTILPLLYCYDNGTFRRIMADTLVISEIGILPDDTAAFVATNFGLYRATRHGIRGGGIPTGITRENTSETEAITIFPIPAGDAVSMQFPAKFFGKPADVTICDATGRVCRRMQFDDVSALAEIETGTLPSGVYRLQIQSGELTKSSVFPVVR
jgi:hypothetical protein